MDRSDDQRLYDFRDTATVIALREQQATELEMAIRRAVER